MDTVTGELHVERNHASWKRPYAGIVPIVEGEIAQDLARYLLESEQKPSAVALGVFRIIGGNASVEEAFTERFVESVRGLRQGPDSAYDVAATGLATLQAHLTAVAP